MRSLTDQVDELGNIRTRSVQFLAFVASANAFLAGAVTKSLAVQRDAWFFGAVIVASACFAAVLALSVVLLWPNWKFRFRTSPAKALEWIDAQVGATEENYLLHLVRSYDSALTFNQKPLSILRGAHLALIVAGVVGTGLMVVVTWYVA